jgi:hypothetical protein
MTEHEADELLAALGSKPCCSTGGATNEVAIGDTSTPGAWVLLWNPDERSWSKSQNPG